MKVYGIADSHFLTRRFNERFDRRAMLRFKNFVDNTVENDSVVTISGDLFDIAVPNSGNNFDIVNQLMTIMNNAADRKGIRFLITSGNHDIYRNVEGKCVGLLEIISKSLGDDTIKYDLNKVGDLPNIVIASSINKTVNITEDGKVYNFTLLGFDNIGDKIIKKPNADFSFLICHGSIYEDYPNDDSIDNSYIEKDITKKFDFVLKGHIHKSYKNGNVYSIGAMMNITSTDKCGYFVFDDSTGKGNLKEFNDGYEIIYINEKCDETNINEKLNLYNENHFVNILYSGSSTAIDGELFSNCFNNCIGFKLIFENEITNNVLRGKEADDKEDLFISIDEYLGQNLEKGLLERLKQIKES